MNNDPVESIRKLTRAWKNKDAEEMAAWLSNDIVEVGPAFSFPLTGKRSFFRHYRGYLRDSQQILSYRMLRPRTIHLSPSLVLVHFKYSMRIELNGLVEKSRGKESMVLKREGKRWLVQFIHWHRDPDEIEA